MRRTTGTHIVSIRNRSQQNEMTSVTGNALKFALAGRCTRYGQNTILANRVALAELDYDLQRNLRSWRSRKTDV